MLFLNSCKKFWRENYFRTHPVVHATTTWACPMFSYSIKFAVISDTFVSCWKLLYRIFLNHVFLKIRIWVFRDVIWIPGDRKSNYVSGSKSFVDMCLGIPQYWRHRRPIVNNSTFSSLTSDITTLVSNKFRNIWRHSISQHCESRNLWWYCCGEGHLKFSCQIFTTPSLFLTVLLNVWYSCI